MRKLVTVQKIIEIAPIDGADNIEVAKVMGWQVVVKKGEFKEGDWCVWHEIDSFLPIHPRFEFLRKGCYRKVEGLGEGFRLKTIRLRGQISQGLALPLSAYDIYQESDKTWKYSDVVGNQYYIHPELEEDLSEIFGVVKYDPPVPATLKGNMAGRFPEFIPKTDEARIQNLLHGRLRKEIIGHEFERSIKLDGTSVTVYNHEGKVGLCSRNWEIKLDNDGNAYLELAKSSGILEKVPDGFAVQMEMYGKGIQANWDSMMDRKFYLFNVYDIVGQKYLTPSERKDFFEKHFQNCEQIQHVPLLENVFLDEDTTVDSLIKISDNTPSINNKNCEGIVYKRLDGQFSFKVISNNWLLINE